MFATDTFIDTIQGAKKYFIDTIVTDKDVQKQLNALVDSETSFTKQVVETNSKLADLVQSTLEKFAKPSKA